jgi:hypothetical protein
MKGRNPCKRKKRKSNSPTRTAFPADVEHSMISIWPVLFCILDAFSFSELLIDSFNEKRLIHEQPPVSLHNAAAPRNQAR